MLLGKVKAAAGFGLLGIGLFCGLGIMVSAIYQGKVAATGILAASKKRGVFGKCFAAMGSNIFDMNIDDPGLYHVILNTSRIPFDRVVNLVADLLVLFMKEIGEIPFR
ncbi:MAG: hypothetical protein JSW39_20970 [Desulfobacterales bacterium]|nr:MAG: hypothetical protein JSW39_20970 [Desulfobacterales bacterium]